MHNVTVQLHSLQHTGNGLFLSSSAGVKEVENAKTEYLAETKKKKKKKKHKAFREEEERPRDKEKLHVELQETNGVDTGKQKPSKSSTGTQFFFKGLVLKKI